MKTVREKFLTVAEAEKATGVHYTVKHSGKMEGMRRACLCCRSPACQGAGRTRAASSAAGGTRGTRKTRRALASVGHE